MVSQLRESDEVGRAGHAVHPAAQVASDVVAELREKLGAVVPLLREDHATRMLLRTALNPATFQPPEFGQRGVFCLGVFCSVANVDLRRGITLGMDEAEHPYVSDKQLEVPLVCALLVVPYMGSPS